MTMPVDDFRQDIDLDSETYRLNEDSMTTEIYEENTGIAEDEDESFDLGDAGTHFCKILCYLEESLVKEELDEIELVTGFEENPDESSKTTVDLFRTGELAQNVYDFLDNKYDISEEFEESFNQKKESYERHPSLTRASRRDTMI